MGYNVILKYAVSLISECVHVYTFFDAARVYFESIHSQHLLELLLKLCRFVDQYIHIRQFVH